ncbi:hypothetical protein [Streptomyces sp. NPDC088727]|uniref:hypothetical protein n=1 Tax=Streptomyces sp. NPDC088727 TaxID=3365875 RepID=UPI0038214DD1
MPLTYWNKRPDLTEELVESLGWKPHQDYPDMIWTNGACTFTLIDRTGRGELKNGDEYLVQFSARVPMPVVLAACEQAAARCQQHGTACEPDDHVEPPTSNGEVI